MAKQPSTNQRTFTLILGIGLSLLVAVSLTLLLRGNAETENVTGNTSGVRTITGAGPIPQSHIIAYAQLADPQTLALGEEVYLARCASCHGADGEGQFPQAPLQPDDTGRIGAPPHDSTGHTWHHDDDLLIRYVIEGGQAPPDRFYPMPAFGEQLSEAEVLAVIAYIKTMWTEEERLIQAERTLMTRAAD